MKKLLLLALLLVPSLAFGQGTPTGPPYVVLCNASIASNMIGGAVSTMIQGVSGKGIFICGWHASTLNTATGSQSTFQLGYTNSTTNNTCSTTVASIALTPFNGVTATAPSVDHPGTGMLAVPLQAASTVSPSSLCINVGAASGQGIPNIQIILYYGQY